MGERRELLLHPTPKSGVIVFSSSSSLGRNGMGERSEPTGRDVLVEQLGRNGMGERSEPTGRDVLVEQLGRNEE